MKKLALAGLFMMLVATAGTTPSVSALSLKVAPLSYDVTLKKGEKQKGVVDISNPTGETVRVKTSTQAFRQVDDMGTLQFFDHEQVSEGVQLDLDGFELGPREAVRMYFQLDSTKLPTGDVFAAIFFTTEPLQPKVGVGQAVRLGTLLSIVNGTPGARSADVTSLNTGFIQFDDVIRGSYAIKNTGDPVKTTGFYPEVNIGVSPFGEHRAEKGKLVFAGRTRQNTFELKAPWIGFYKVSAQYGASEQSKWIFVVHPWALIVLLIALASVVIARSARRTYRRRKTKRSFKLK
jgi:hypothetical protein